MKIKLLAIMTAMFLLCTVTAAQDYYIRTANRSNLRAAASLEGEIIETAPANTTLHVIGKFNRWLKINRNGKEAWVADWLSYTRLENGAATTSDVDNCCFVDRQCNRDEDWVSGYWAYQNNQCNAPAQSQPQSSSQPASNDAAQVDNCCFLGWQCQGDDEWLTGFYAYQTNQCEHRGTAIQGSEIFVIRVKEALDLLKDRSPMWYDYATIALDRIEEIDPSRISGTYGHGKTFFLSPDLVISDTMYQRLWLISAFVHEACHIYQYENIYRDKIRPPISIEEAEAECVQYQIDVLQVIDPLDRFITHFQLLIDNIYDPEIQWWN